MPEVTAYDVIQKRQIELINESQSLRAELAQIKLREEEINRKLAENEIEYRIFDSYSDRGQMVSYTRETVTISSGRRRNPTDRLLFEDVVKKVFDNAGRPIMIGELIKELEHFGFQWSSDASAYAYITTSSIVERAGKRGFYQLVRN